MALYLIESTIKGIATTKEELDQKVSEIQSNLNENKVSIIEVQVSRDFSRCFIIIKGEENAASEILSGAGFHVELVKEVRLVGKDLGDVKKNNDIVNYLVEWNLPEDLTMDRYLARKKKNSIHYQEVPEVEFLRTYVCEDMTKCLCFYDAPDEDAVKRAREAVKTPIDTITELA